MRSIVVNNPFGADTEIFCDVTFMTFANLVTEYMLLLMLDKRFPRNDFNYLCHPNV